MSISNLANKFLKIDSTKPVIFKEITEETYKVKIRVENGSLALDDRNIYHHTQVISDEFIQIFFNNIRIKEEKVDNNFMSKDISIGKVNLNLVKDNFKVTAYLKFLHANTKKNQWLLGLDEFGPKYFDLEKMVHAAIFGSTGFGKTSFIKYLLSSTLAHFTDVDNIIIDPKSTDLALFKDHPRCTFYGSSTNDYNSILESLMLEVKFREHVFSNSFANPPANLKDYNTLKLSHKRQDLPVFNRMFIWIDEFHTFRQRNSKIHHLLRVARSFGIHIIISTQCEEDIYSDASEQINLKLSFYTPTLRNHHTKNSALNLPIPGRIYYKDPEDNIYEYAQTPFSNTNDALLYAYGIDNNPKKGIGFFPLKLNHDILGGITSDFLKDGNSLMDLNSVAIEKRTRYRDDEFEHTFKHIYDNSANNIDIELSLKDSTTNEILANISVKKIKKTDNKIKVKEILSSYNELLLKSHINIDLFLYDLSNNSGIKTIRNVILLASLGEQISENPPRKLVLRKSNLETIASIFDSVSEAIKYKKQLPLVTIIGEFGLGKKTIKDYLITKIKEFHLENSPIIQFIDGLKGLTENEMDLRLHDQSNNILRFIILTEVPEIGFEFKKIKSHIDELLINVETPNTFLNITNKDYNELGNGNELIKALLEKYEYVVSEETVGTKLLSSHCVKLIPSAIDILFKEARTMSKFKKTSFNYEILDYKLKEHKRNSQLENSAVSIHSFNPSESQVAVILPLKTMGEIDEIMAKASMLGKIKYKYYENLREGESLICLFSGVPGTGKTHTARQLAFKMKKDLWVCDLSKLTSAYFGETEKIITSLFHQAEVAEAVLLIDECDAIMGARQDSSEVMKRVMNTVLSLMDSYKGILLLTTNFPQALDGALSRRMNYKLDFPMPNQSHMLQILQMLLEPDAPLEPKFDYNHLFDSIELSGGLIRNAVECATVKMHMRDLSYLTTELMREALLDTYQSAELIAPRKTKIGI